MWDVPEVNRKGFLTTCRMSERPPKRKHEDGQRIDLSDFEDEQQNEGEEPLDISLVYLVFEKAIRENQFKISHDFLAHFDNIIYSLLLMAVQQGHGHVIPTILYHSNPHLLFQEAFQHNDGNVARIILQQGPAFWPHALSQEQVSFAFITLRNHPNQGCFRVLEGPNAVPQNLREPLTLDKLQSCFLAAVASGQCFLIQALLPLIEEHLPPPEKTLAPSLYPFHKAMLNAVRDRKLNVVDTLLNYKGERSLCTKHTTQFAVRAAAQRGFAEIVARFIDLDPDNENAPSQDAVNNALKNTLFPRNGKKCSLYEAREVIRVLTSIPQDRKNAPSQTCMKKLRQQAVIKYGCDCTVVEPLEEVLREPFPSRGAISLQYAGIVGEVNSVRLILDWHNRHAATASEVDAVFIDVFNLEVLGLLLRFVSKDAVLKAAQEISKIDINSRSILVDHCPSDVRSHCLLRAREKLRFLLSIQGPKALCQNDVNELLIQGIDASSKVETLLEHQGSNAPSQSGYDQALRSALTQTSFFSPHSLDIITRFLKLEYTPSSQRDLEEAVFRLSGKLRNIRILLNRGLLNLGQELLKFTIPFQKRPMPSSVLRVNLFLGE